MATTHISASDRLLANAVYQERTRLPRYNIRPTVYSTVSDRDAGKVLVKLKPDWSSQYHDQLAKQHAKLVEKHQAQYEKALNAAALETFGRPFEFSDYRISCIGREEFSEEWKEILRYHGRAASKHQLLARAHLAASTSRAVHH